MCRCLEIWGSQPPGALRACNKPVQGLLYLLPFFVNYKIKMVRVKFGIRPQFLTKVLQDVGTGDTTNYLLLYTNRRCVDGVYVRPSVY